VNYRNTLIETLAEGDEKKAISASPTTARREGEPEPQPGDIVLNTAGGDLDVVMEEKGSTSPPTSPKATQQEAAEHESPDASIDDSIFIVPEYVLFLILFSFSLFSFLLASFFLSSLFFFSIFVDWLYFFCYLLEILSCSFVFSLF
jgi:hypothetical protein